MYHGARTGRDTGSMVQLQNLVKAGPKLNKCGPCGHIYGTGLKECSNCGEHRFHSSPTEWAWEAVDEAVEALKSHSLEHVESMYGDAVLTVSGCIRGLLTPAPRYKYISSDYSAIEAVVAACLAGEQWRIDAFKAKKDIYLVSASSITKTPYEEYVAYKEETGSKHPDRQKIGKVAELALGYAGWVNAWRNFDSTDTYTDDEVKRLILKWQEASPAIIEMWGGQVRGKPWRPDYVEYYGLEGAAIQATLHPGTAFSYRQISFQVHEDILFCLLPSGRTLKYHQPRLTAHYRWEGLVQLSFMGWNSNPQMGPLGWVRIETFGGRLFENVVQAVSRDILRDAVNNSEKAGYNVVMRIHDELVAEVPIGFGSVEEFEAIMGDLPGWAKDWPIRADGGWAGYRFRKD